MNGKDIILQFILHVVNINRIDVILDIGFLPYSRYIWDQMGLKLRTLTNTEIELFKFYVNYGDTFQFLLRFICALSAKGYKIELSINIGKNVQFSVSRSLPEIVSHMLQIWKTFL